MDGSIPPLSGLSSASSSSSSAIFRPRRSDDWLEYRPAIEQLYRDHQLKLREVKRIMERDYNFHASEKQYKDRLASWHVRKNIKAKDIKIMIRKQQKRAARGKQTAFRVNGQEVDQKRIARFARRKGTNWENHSRDNAAQPSPEPGTPTDMSCYTPDGTDRASTLSPLPEFRSIRRDERSEPLPDSETDETRSMQVTLSPSQASTTTTNVLDDKFAPTEEDPWAALTDFQNRLRKLDHDLEVSLADYVSPHEHHE
ncbi:Clr5 domain-containing protein [Aspergillus candidus]|uniref:Clr5 domain-domain-containing protein n=1 Tax=Aspergillus candidus TaxID=41067 RepID=A0A2I2F003_ASPCN|nr:Clr5 domain-domain-containing protein [Aspergillus candidus]PLB33959.1 Clr5 domain-domain-containing protein [Aspergillus candidus]